MKNWLIKKLGGYTRAETADLRARYDAIPAVWDDAVRALKMQDKVTIIDGNVQIDNIEITGALIVSPRAHAHFHYVTAGRAFFPVDEESNIH